MAMVLLLSTSAFSSRMGGSSMASTWRRSRVRAISTRSLKLRAAARALPISRRVMSESFTVFMALLLLSWSGIRAGDNKKRPGNRLSCSRDDKSLIAVPPGFTQTRALVRAPTSPCPGNGGKAVPPYRKPSLGRPAPAPAAIPPAYRLAPPAGSLKAAPVWHNAFHALRMNLFFSLSQRKTFCQVVELPRIWQSFSCKNCELFLFHHRQIREEPLILGCGPHWRGGTGKRADDVFFPRHKKMSAQSPLCSGMEGAVKIDISLR